jgi:putative FmdB family regulatory protein
MREPADNTGVAMPTYEYRCLECDEIFERSTKMADLDTTQPACPRCGSEKVEQVFSAFFAKTSRKS